MWPLGVLGCVGGAPVLLALLLVVAAVILALHLARIRGSDLTLPLLLRR